MQPISLQYGEKLLALYGVRFPDSFFWFLDFLIDLGVQESIAFLKTIGLTAAGPIELITHQDCHLESNNPNPDAIYHHWLREQYDRDLPEFLTCLKGEHDGLHFGLLCDEPCLGIRGAASFYNSDGDVIQVYGSILEAIADQLAFYIEEYKECIGEELDVEYYQSYLKAAKKYKSRFNRFIQQNNVHLDDGRSVGSPSDTGLGVLSSTTVTAEANQQAVDLLLRGRSLWYWGDDQSDLDRLQQSYDAMKQAYELMNRSMLIEILNLYFQQRLIWFSQ
jgi:hypothetical protein